MADKSRERNYVDMFSDYGLDERQKLINAEIGIKCFKSIFYGVLWLTCIWLVIYVCLEGVTIPFGYIALSYYALTVVCECIYAVRTSRYGSVNGITAFQWSGKGAVVSMFMLASILFFRITSSDEPIDHKFICLLIMTVIAIANNLILYFCGKRNFEALDEESTDDTDESEEE